MDIIEARKKLGKRSENMSDEQIGDLVTQMDVLSNFMIDFILEQIKKNRREGETANDCLKRLNIMWQNKS
ncbi:hypothetical protein A3C59_05330 [Candidatus Daviesbacteria bacterium RIFCSPHIGHO2_02_FULL_36_13]|uniref:Uncharacterized protein n=1 Tax=Candidatus Daviesbacteria bacterium RIFCSPHIGHO2_02_FULL_36_13 TaxID=1797768 RepID=A0A1F5JSG3_9BACT|nr:MAG: hypothetical protein A3C59_05330 [Candidatus Daviesbacteria bacterium RIFCSPHIGHO2_02_FULL_36_13]